MYRFCFFFFLADKTRHRATCVFPSSLLNQSDDLLLGSEELLSSAELLLDFAEELEVVLLGVLVAKVLGQLGSAGAVDNPLQEGTVLAEKRLGVVELVSLGKLLGLGEPGKEEKEKESKQPGKPKAA